MRNEPATSAFLAAFVYGVPALPSTRVWWDGESPAGNRLGIYPLIVGFSTDKFTAWSLRPFLLGTIRAVLLSEDRQRTSTLRWEPALSTRCCNGAGRRVSSLARSEKIAGTQSIGHGSRKSFPGSFGALQVLPISQGDVLRQLSTRSKADSDKRIALGPEGKYPTAGSGEIQKVRAENFSIRELAVAYSGAKGFGSIVNRGYFLPSVFQRFL